MRRTVGWIAVGLAALAGCGSDDGEGDERASGDESASPGDDRAAGGVWATELEDGSELRVRLDVDPSDPAVEPFEQLRAATGAEEPTWIVADIDVSDDISTPEGTGRFLTFLEDGVEPLDDDPLDDADGATSSDFACSVLDTWLAGAPSMDDDLNDQYLELHDGPCGGQTAQVLAPAGEVTTYVMVYEGELPDFDRVFAGLAHELRRL